MAQGIQQYRLPDAGEGLTEAEIVRWAVQPGDEVTINQPLLEVETAKAVVELPSPYAGTVSELLVAEGTTVPVGTPIITIAGGEGAAAAPEGSDTASSANGSTAADETKAEPVLVGYGVKEAPSRRRRRSRPEATTAPPSNAPNGQAEAPAPTPAPTPARSTRALAKPPVRKLAKDLGVDLSSVDPSGPGGVVTRDDVRKIAEAPIAEATAGDGEERIPVRGVRKHTAAAMVSSAFTAPHVTEFLQIDATETVRAAKRLRKRREFDDIKVSPLLLVAKALLVAARRYPELNSSWDDDAGEIVLKRYVNLGIAAATPRGLVIPTVHDAHTMSLPDLAKTLHENTETARAGRATPAQLSGGTITITNVGVFGVDAGTPIINPGEAAILAIGQIRDMPWVHRDKLAIRKVTTLALSFDHRIIDGEVGSKALRDMGEMLEDPLTALAWS